MSRYYVKKEKLKRLERQFKSDIRWIKSKGIKFNMSIQAVWNGETGKRGRYVVMNEDEYIGDAECGVCLVGAHVIACDVKRFSENISNDCSAAAKDLRVKDEWLYELYQTYPEDDMDGDVYSPYPQAKKLARRLIRYAQKIGA